MMHDALRIVELSVAFLFYSVLFWTAVEVPIVACRCRGASIYPSVRLSEVGTHCNKPSYIHTTRMRTALRSQLRRSVYEHVCKAYSDLSE